MNKLLIVILTVLSLVFGSSCDLSGPTPLPATATIIPSTTTPSPTPRPSQIIMEKYFRYWKEQDATLMASLFEPLSEYSNPAFHQEWFDMFAEYQGEMIGTYYIGEHLTPEGELLVFYAIRYSSVLPSGSDNIFTLSTVFHIQNNFITNIE